MEFDGNKFAPKILLNSHEKNLIYYQHTSFLTELERSGSAITIGAVDPKIDYYKIFPQLYAFLKQ
jgi:hypothetical protein